MTKKELRNYVTTGIAKELKKVPQNEERYYECISLTFGTYGMNGGLFRDIRDKELYVILSRNTLLFRLI